MINFSRYAVLTGALAMSFSAFAFKAEMSLPQVEKEVREREQKKETLAEIIAAASAVNTLNLTTALCTQGFAPDTILGAMINAKRPVAEVVAAEVAVCGATEQQLANVLVAAGMDPTAYLKPTAAGGDQPGGGDNFVRTPTATTGGGGGAASRS